MSDALQRLIEADRLVQLGLREFDKIIARANEASARSMAERHSPEEIAEAMAFIEERNVKNRHDLACQLWIESLAILSAASSAERVTA